MKTPPDRAGIVFEVGAPLEARERHKKWYSATIRRIDCERERVLVHYQRWRHRHDEWFQWDSPLLRPLERVGLRRQGLTAPRSPPVFAAGVKVLACWTDCRFYPAKILSVNGDDSYKVRFYDGVVRTVKPTKVKPFQENSRAEKTVVGREGWEDGGSEEESVDKREEKRKEGEDEKEAEEKVTTDEKEGGESEEEERKREAERPSSHPAAKKQADESRSSRGPNALLTGDPPLLAPPTLPHVDRDLLLERQAHLPTTHKFSREPLYRVIKNQPPPILSIELDHNPFKCPAAGCSKSFRKASLLHYHIKYYHSEQREDACVGEEPPGRRRRRSSSKRDDFVPGLKSEDQIQTCHHEDRDPGAMETAELQKDAGGDKTAQDRKDRRNFLRVKLKKKKMKKRKKKKRKSQPGLCSSDEDMSDQAAVPLKPCGLHNTPPRVDDGSDWSTLTAESGEDTPPWPVATETEECELVRCVCEVDEENDFMIQCESCLCWQHGTCMGLYEDNVPHNYICYYCRHCAGWRPAQHFLSEPELLISGQMFGLSCVKDNYSQMNASKICHTSRLLGHVQVLAQVLGGLKLQLAMLHSPSHPELKLWRLPWKREEGALCYVSSEHCYQKPGACWEKPPDTVKGEQEDKTPADGCREAAADAAGREEDAAAPTAAAERRAAAAGCQLNLLEHVEALHQQVSSRMELIERELDVLESWLDHSGELEPPDPLSRLPQLKQRIRWLLHDLSTVRRLSFWR